MTQFHESQDVEVTTSRYPLATFNWRKAKIIERYYNGAVAEYSVQFPDGTRGVFDAERIRAAYRRYVTHDTEPMDGGD